MSAATSETTTWTHTEALEWCYDVAYRAARNCGEHEHASEIALQAVREAWFWAGWDDDYIIALLDGHLAEYAARNDAKRGRAG